LPISHFVVRLEPSLVLFILNIEIEQSADAVMHANSIRKKDWTCEPPEFSWAWRYRSVGEWPSKIPLSRKNIAERWSNRLPARQTFSGFAASRYRTSTASWHACGKTPPSSAGDAARCSIQVPARPIKWRRYVATARRSLTANKKTPYRRSSHTSTHSAATSSAIRDGAICTALWIEPAAGSTSSNACSDTSQ
jgi:hypothetical protein